MYVAQKLAKHCGWKRGCNTMIRPTFCLFAEKNVLSNYRVNIQVSSHVLPYDWRKHENRTGWAHNLNSQHDLVGKAPRHSIQGFFDENICYRCKCCTYLLCVEKQASLVWNQPQRMLSTYSVSRRGRTGPCVAQSDWQSWLLTKPQICRLGFRFPRLHKHPSNYRIHWT